MQEFAKSQERPFTVSIMGQTGVGKTSLIKALFNKVFSNKMNSNSVNDVEPATLKPETYSIKGENGQLLIVHDLPGIGESTDADQNHLDTYRQFLKPSDLVLWAIQADNRSTTFDAQALGHLLATLDDQEKEQLMSKLIFLLTKVDSLVPSPWLMRYYHQQQIVFAPGIETVKLIEKKQAFFLKQLVQPYGKYIVSHTHNQEGFALDLPSFEYDKNRVTYRGPLMKQQADEWSKQFPAYEQVFLRLYENICPLPCSARFKYSLPQLVHVILNRIDPGTAQNLKRLVAPDSLNTMSLNEARQLCNLIIWHNHDECKILDLEDGIFPHPKWDNMFYNKNKTRLRPKGFFNRRRGQSKPEML